MTDKRLDLPYYQVLKSPLCGFSLSPPFSIRTFTSRPLQRSASRRLSVRSWRRGGSCLPSVRPRFKPFNRRSSNSLPKYLSEFLISSPRGRTLLSLQEVLNEIQKVWNSSPSRLSESSSVKMDERFRKSSSISHNEILSPILLRRRLSAPETIMRKHMLAQERSGSQDSEITQSSEARSCQWRGEIDAGSDSNLNRKREPDLMRKSTLLRRLWSHTKPPSNTSRSTGTFYEWQHSGKLSTHSLTSIHSSPEHIVRSQSKRSLNGEFRTSPQHKQQFNSGRKMSPKHQVYDTNKQQSPKRKTSVFYNNGNFDSFSDVTRSTATTLTPKTITENTETESSVNYTSSITNSYTTFSENSDSAYTNSTSNFSEILTVNNNNNNNSTSTPSEIYKSVREETDASNQDPARPHHGLQQTHHKTALTDKNINREVNETSVQTSSTTNVNVISNVELSQSTLDLIFDHVMEDVRKTFKTDDNLNESGCSFSANENQTLKVQQVPSFYLKQPKDGHNADSNSRIVKYMISNVGTGSPYSKPAEVPQIVVPRFSALPRTASMEVNMSSGAQSVDDKESDTVSLVDSLEDSSTFSNLNNSEVTGKINLTPPLPDNSDQKRVVPSCSKPTAFYIPIEINDQKEFKAVSDHLPEKVRNKLTKRQQKRQEKMDKSKSMNSSSRSDSNYISASDNGNQFSFLIENNGSDVNLNSTPVSRANYNIHRQKKRNKPFLPSIETFRKTKGIEKSNNNNFSNNSTTNKREPNCTKKKSEHNYWLKPNRTPTYTSKNEYVYEYGPGRIYHKTEFNDDSKRIEILQIMECVEASEKINQQFLSKNKSKIPIFVHHHKLPKINQSRQQTSRDESNKHEKPTFLDLDGVQISDPKLDQLIANILIETLNNPDLRPASSTEKSVDTPAVKGSPTSKFQRKFEAIPEELSLQSSTDDKSNNNNDSSISESNNNAGSNNYQGRAAVAVVRDENFSSIPKGWITFYMLHKNNGSPDSTSDEGKKFGVGKSNNTNKQYKTEAEKKNNEKLESEHNKILLSPLSSPSLFDVLRKKCNSFESNDHCSSTSSGNQVQNTMPQNVYNSKQKKVNNSQRKRYKNNSSGEKTKSKQFGEWSVTVSGTNSYSQLTPNLEMCLKFPGRNNSQKQSPDENQKSNVYKPQNNELSEDAYSPTRLPDIQRNNKVARNEKIKKSASSLTPSIPNSISSRFIEPRQTQTSVRRYNLTRPKVDYSLETSRNTLHQFFDERRYAEILRRFPEILSITGSAVCQDKK